MSEPIGVVAHAGYVFLDVPDDCGCLTYEQTMRLIWKLQRASGEAIKHQLRGLDGSTRSAVQMLTGFSDEKLEELGGVEDE
jgi:hypothetical protein